MIMRLSTTWLFTLIPPPPWLWWKMSTFTFVNITTWTYSCNIEKAIKSSEEKKEKDRLSCPRDLPTGSHNTDITSCTLFTLDTFSGDPYLVLKLLLPGVVKRVYNINSKQLVKLFSQVWTSFLFFLKWWHWWLLMVLHEKFAGLPHIVTRVGCMLHSVAD